MTPDEVALILERTRAVKRTLRIVPNASVRRLPKVTRGKALSDPNMNGRITEVAAVTMPRSANQRAATPRSKVTGVTSGSNIHGASYEDAVAPTHRAIERTN